MIEELGYVKSGDGWFRDGAGQRIEVEIRTSAENDNNVKLLYPVVDYWQRVGIAAEPLLVATQQRDREYRAAYPGFQVVRHPNDASRVENFHSSRIPTRENNWTGGNDPAYQNPDYDALFERYSTTIPMRERISRSMATTWSAGSGPSFRRPSSRPRTASSRNRSPSAASALARST